MRILVDPDSLNHKNVGGLAMLHVALARLRALWPTARIQVLTNMPEALAAQWPDVEPIAHQGLVTWLADEYLLGRVHHYLPRSISYQLGRMKRAFGRRWPALLVAAIQLRMQIRSTANGDPRPFLEAVDGANLFVTTGAGHFTDLGKSDAYLLLDALEMLLRRGTPIALFGQGVGPLRDAELRVRASAVLPRVDLIAVRERRAGPALLALLGVPLDRVLLTGDDAIELAYQARPAQLGNGVGVNLRVAPYAGVDHTFIDILRPIIQKFVRLHDVPLIPVPIQCNLIADDPACIRQLLVGYDDQSDGGQALDTPLKVIEQAGRCRIIVAGAYHAAVFGLSQGIPTVCLAQSDYYVEKLLGLADQFGAGCEVVLLDSPDLPAKLTSAIDRAWSSAEQVRQPLLDAAARQIEMGHVAYQRLEELVRPKCTLARSSSEKALHNGGN